MLGCAYCVGLRRMPRSSCAFRAVGNAGERLSSVRLLILASMAPSISRRVRF